MYGGYNDCVTIVAPYKVTTAAPLIVSQFKQGRDDLTSSSRHSQRRSSRRAVARR